jgi:hypothetical protein
MSRSRINLTLDLAQVIVQAVEAGFVYAAITLEPFVDVFKGARLQPARPPLRLASLRDQAGMLQHLQVLGNRRQAQLKGLGQLGYRRLTLAQPRQNGAPGGVGQGCKGDAEVIVCDGHVFYRLDNYLYSKIQLIRLTVKRQFQLLIGRSRAAGRSYFQCFPYIVPSL